MKIEIAKSSDIPVLCDLLDSLFTQESEFKSDRNSQIRGLSSVIKNDDVGDILFVRENDNIITRGAVKNFFFVTRHLSGATF